MNIFLIGYRCTGKTSVGKCLSNYLGKPFLDSDLEIVKEDGRTISQIVSQEGWTVFRNKEKSIIKKICTNDGYVIATGGGVILDDENTKLMKSAGVLVLLKARADTIKKRMLHDKSTNDQRPSLTSNSIDQEIEETLINRLPLQEKAMDFFIDTDELNVEDVCMKIVKRLREME